MVCPCHVSSLIKPKMITVRGILTKRSSREQVCHTPSQGKICFDLCSPPVSWFSDTRPNTLGRRYGRIQVQLDSKLYRRKIRQLNWLPCETTGQKTKICGPLTSVDYQRRIYQTVPIPTLRGVSDSKNLCDRRNSHGGG